MHTVLKSWLQQASVPEQKALAQETGTKVPYLRHLGAGRRAASPGLARLIERATQQLHRSSKGRLPVIYRTDLAEACRHCEFAERCLGSVVVVRSEFASATPPAAAPGVSESEGGHAD